MKKKNLLDLNYKSQLSHWEIEIFHDSLDKKYLQLSDIHSYFILQVIK